MHLVGLSVQLDVRGLGIAQECRVVTEDYTADQQHCPAWVHHYQLGRALRMEPKTFAVCDRHLAKIKILRTFVAICATPLLGRQVVYNTYIYICAPFSKYTSTQNNQIDNTPWWVFFHRPCTMMHTLFTPWENWLALGYWFDLRIQLFRLDEFFIWHLAPIIICEDCVAFLIRAAELYLVTISRRDEHSTTTTLSVGLCSMLLTVTLVSSLITVRFW